jgi:uncharacterized protein
MNSTFLNAAQQGINSWRAYLKGILILLFASPTIFIASFIFVYTGLYIFLPGFREIKSADILYGPFLGCQIWPVLFSVFFYSLTIFVLKIVVERIHRRRFITLVNAEEAPVDWARVMQGFGVGLGLHCLLLFLVYLVKPDRYTFSFNAAEWFFSAGFSLLLSGLMSVFIGLVIYGYLLQGLARLIKKPTYIYAFTGVLTGLLSIIFSASSRTFIDWLVVSVTAMLCLLLVLKEERLELLVGYMMSFYFYQFSILETANRKQLPFSTRKNSGPAGSRGVEGVE